MTDDLADDTVDRAADREYLLQVLPPEYTVEEPASLWRRSGGSWEYLSLVDWSWHEVPSPAVPQPPPPENLVAIDPARAERLATDRQFWFRYWAEEASPPPHGSGEPYTVIRLRASPEGEVEEAFGRENRWITSTTLGNSRWGDPTPLRRIDRAEAEAILQRIRGVTGATEL